MILKRVGFKSAAAGSGHFLERQTLGPHPTTTESQTLGVGWFSCPLSARTTTPDYNPLLPHHKSLNNSFWMLVGSIHNICQRITFHYFIFLILFINFIEGQLLYRISLFSAKYQHESAIGIPLPLEPPSHLPYHATPPLFFKLILHCLLLVKQTFRDGAKFSSVRKFILIWNQLRNDIVRQST